MMTTIHKFSYSTENIVGRLQSAVQLMYELRGFDASPQTLVLGATEELGEVAMAVLLTCTADFKPSDKKLSAEWADARDVASEVGDTITYLLALCNKLHIEPKFKWMTVVTLTSSE